MEGRPTGLAGFSNGLTHSGSEELSGRREVFRPLGSAASEDEALGDCPSSTLGGDSTGNGCLHTESSHCLKLMHKTVNSAASLQLLIKVMPSSLQCPEKADAPCQSGGPGLQQAVMAVSGGSPEGSGAHTWMAYVLVYCYNTSSTISLKAKEYWDGFTPVKDEGPAAFDAKERQGLLDHVHRHL